MDLKTHAQILRDAFARGALGSHPSLPGRSLRWIIIANQLSDLHLFTRPRHFDCARSPAEVCELWEKGLGHFMELSVRRLGPGWWGRPNRFRSWRGLAAFGAATHALADFYAHTNWVEIFVEQGETPPLAPLTGSACRPEMFPAALQSGYFSLRYGLSGCPRVNGRWAPPGGFRYCHAGLNKDSATTGHGAELTSPGGPTFHDLAARLATQSTLDLWDQLCSRLLLGARQ